MSATAPSKRRRFRNSVRAGEYGPMHLRRGRGYVLALANQVAAMPQVTGAAATAGSLSATITWAIVPNANYYIIEQSANGSTGWVAIATVNGGSTSYKVTGLTASVAQFWRVSAVNGAGVAGVVSSNVTATPTA